MYKTRSCNKQKNKTKKNKNKTTTTTTKKQKMPQRNCLKQSQNTLFITEKNHNRKRPCISSGTRHCGHFFIFKVSRTRWNIFKPLLEKHKQLDTFTVDHLLWKLNSNKCKTHACTSPINCTGLPYFTDHLNTKYEQQLICIPLGNGAHFQDIIDIDRNKTRNHTSQRIANLYFESNSNVR